MGLDDKIIAEKMNIDEKYLKKDFIQKFEELQIGDTNMLLMTTTGKKILYNSMFIRVLPDDESVKKKELEIEELRSNVN